MYFGHPSLSDDFKKLGLDEQFQLSRRSFETNRRIIDYRLIFQKCPRLTISFYLTAQLLSISLLQPTMLKLYYRNNKKWQDVYIQNP